MQPCNKDQNVGNFGGRHNRRVKNYYTNKPIGAFESCMSAKTERTEDQLLSLVFTGHGGRYQRNRSRGSVGNAQLLTGSATSGAIWGQAAAGRSWGTARLAMLAVQTPAR